MGGCRGYFLDPCFAKIADVLPLLVTNDSIQFKNILVTWF